MVARKASSGHVDQATLEPPAKKINRTKDPMASGGASSSLGACQPGTTPPATTLVEFRVVSFNFGIKQAMIGPPTMRGTLYAGYNNYCWNFARICDTIVQKGQVDLLFGCEVGGFRQGFRCTSMNVWDILQTRLGSTVSVAEVDNYIAVFRKSSALLHGPSSKFTFGEGCFDAAITRFDICPGGASQPAVHVIVGNLHIDYSNNPRWSVLERQKIVRLLRDELETYTAPQPDMPVVRLIVGDDNLSTEEACQALQQEKNTDPLWGVTPAVKEGRGDHVAVNGASVRLISVPVGRSFENRGTRNHRHNAVGVVISVRGAFQPAEGRREKRPN